KSIIAADGIYNNGEILTCILSQIPSATKLFENLYSVLPSISTSTAQTCLEIGKQTKYDKTNYGEMRKSNGLSKRSYFGVHLKCFDSSRELVEMEMHFAAARGCSDTIWDKVPLQYDSVHFNGETTTRGSFFNFRGVIIAGSVMSARAYRT
ncbi:hypothetical protein PFISCL1PPCAC_25537, partial [Pristionchus fissidentatus]